MRIPRVAPLAVDPEPLSAAGAAVVAAGDDVAAALGALTAGFSANTGQDAAGEVFGLAYQDAAESLLKAAAAGINALRYNGVKIQLCASNYSKAEAFSTIGGGGGGVLPAPSEPAKITAPGPPGTLGPGVAAPLLWTVVEALIDDAWPNGDVAALHAAAGRWRAFGAALSGARDALNGPKSAVAGQQMPESALIQPVLSTIGTDMADLGAQCGKLATKLDEFADDVAHAQNAIRDLLHRLGTVSGLWHEVVSFLDGDELEEIKKIAADINDLLHHMKEEAQANAQVLEGGMQVIDGWVRSMEKYMRGEFTHFLGQGVGNQVATAFDTFVNTEEGVVKGAVGLVETGQQLDPTRSLFDSKGASATWGGLIETLGKSHLLYAVVDPDDALKNDVNLLKGVVHAEDWRADRPGLGFGENVFDVATLFVPGAGEAGAGAKGVAAGARGAEAGAEGADAAGAVGRVGRVAGELGEVAGAGGALADIGKAGGGLTKDLENLGGGLPKTDSPLGGRPVGLPAPDALPPRTTEFDAGGKPPFDPSAAPSGSEPPKPPIGPHGSAPGSAGAPHDPVSAAVASPHDPAPGPVGGLHDPVSAPAGGPHDPVPVSAGGPHEPVALPAPGWHPPSLPALPGEHGPPTIPQLSEPAPAGVPVSPSGSPVESAPAAAPSPQPAPALLSVAPHGSAPHLSGGGRPAELPAPDGSATHEPADGVRSGGHPGGRGPRGGAPHEPGHGSAPGGHHPGSPSDGGPSGPGRGDPSDGGREDPVHSHEPSGDGWHRLPDQPIDPHYGEPLSENWDFADDPTDPNRINQEVAKLIDDHKAPFGRDPHGNAYTEQQYAERFNKIGDMGQHWANFPLNDGAVPGARVAYTDPAAYLRDYGSLLDRVGKTDGKYLAVMEDGQPASWEQRALHVNSLRDPYNAYTFGKLPEGWTIEVSEVAPGVGQPGGSIQVRVFDGDGKVQIVDGLKERGVVLK